jgi:hypothetical protein
MLTCLFEFATNVPQLCDERYWGTQCFRLDEYTKKNECLKRPTMPAYSKTAVSGWQTYNSSFEICFCIILLIMDNIPCFEFSIYKNSIRIDLDSQ